MERNQKNAQVVHNDFFGAGATTEIAAPFLTEGGVIRDCCRTGTGLIRGIKYSMEQNSFDAIVVGSGMSGGWAAKELTEKGLKTLVLERGRMVRHPDYPTATKDPWDLPYGNRITQETRHRKPVQSRTGYPTPANQHWFVDDLDNPYVEEQPFDWLRGYHVGGRSLMWARQSYRFGPLDFEANAKEGVGIPWPVTYDEIAPWYDKAEIFAGISGSVEGLPSTARRQVSAAA